MRIHHLKTHPEPFAAVKYGLKTFEFRKDDRTVDYRGENCDGYQVGDVLVLREWTNHGDVWEGSFTGATATRVVTYKIAGPAFGVPEGYYVLSLGPVPGEFRM